eukprot:3806632-Prymnesium_polylepis.1
MDISSDCAGREAASAAASSSSCSSPAASAVAPCSVCAASSSRSGRDSSSSSLFSVMPSAIRSWRNGGIVSSCFSPFSPAACAAASFPR